MRKAAACSAEYGIDEEIMVADNGGTDGSQWSASDMLAIRWQPQIVVTTPSTT
jgi:hypothetical protein